MPPTAGSDRDRHRILAARARFVDAARLSGPDAPTAALWRRARVVARDLHRGLGGLVFEWLEAAASVRTLP
ncbi:MAG TPA: hypothetical protein GXZ45_09545 [Propionibacterium sp.]|nr:hypothetical protein [Propionibacterium sp.]